MRVVSQSAAAIDADAKEQTDDVAADGLLLVCSPSPWREQVCRILAGGGYRVELAQTLDAAQQGLMSRPPAIVLVGGLVADRHMIDTCTRLTGRGGRDQPPVVAVVCSAETAGIVALLDAADDCIVTGSVADDQLVRARLVSILRRRRGKASTAPAATSCLCAGAIRLHPDRYDVFVNHEPVTLSVAQFRLLSALFRRPGWTYSAKQLRDAVGPELLTADNDSIKSLVYSLRRRLGPLAAQQIQTVRSVGYRLIAQPLAPDAD